MQAPRFRAPGRRAVILVALVSSTALATPALAQVAAPAPVRNNIDGNGVDLFLGTMNVDGPVLSAGKGAQGLTWGKMIRGGNGWGDTLIGTLSISGSTVYISFGGITHRFTQSGSVYTSTEGDGATLTNSSGTYTFTAADGTEAVFTTSYVGAYPYGNVQGVVRSVAKPDGETFSYNYTSLYYCAASKPGGQGQICTQHRYAYRIASVTNNSQYDLTFNYANYDPTLFDPTQVPDNTAWQGWGDVTSVTMSNAAVSGSTTRSQSFGESYTGGNSYYNITDALGRTTKYRMVSGEWEVSPHRAPQARMSPSPTIVPAGWPR